jgi:hypothetical protein
LSNAETLPALGTKLRQPILKIRRCLEPLNIDNPVLPAEELLHLVLGKVLEHLTVWTERLLDAPGRALHALGDLTEEFR